MYTADSKWKGVFIITIDTKTVISMTEANENFYKVTRIADQYGRAVVFKDNAPRYVVIQFAADQVEDAPKTDVLASANKMMNLYDDAFQELAK